jgi:hypothetical protein
VGAVAIGTMALAAPAMAAGPAASVTPHTGLVNGQKVTVKFSGYPANTSVIVLQCQKAIKTASDATNYCNLKNIKQVKTTTGTGSTPFNVTTGAIGKLGKCVSKSTCVIAVVVQKPATAKFPTIVFK